MNCLICQHNNPPRAQFCQKCGKKMVMSAEEVRQELYKKRQGEIEEETEYYSRQALIVGAVLFVLAFIVWISAGDPPTGYFIPSAARNSQYSKIDYSPSPAIEKLWAPYETKFE